MCQIALQHVGKNRTGNDITIGENKKAENTSRRT